LTAALSPTGFLGPAEVDALMARYGVPMARQAVVADTDAAADAAAEIGLPVAVKGFNARLIHKRQAGLLALGVASAADVRAAARAILSRGGESTELVVQETAAPGLELIVGARRDPVFGPVVLVGLGGVWTEVMDDVAVQPAPLGADDAARMLERLRAAPVIADHATPEGHVHRELCRTVAAVGRLVAEEDDVAEVDVNPLIVSGDSIVAVDARVRIAEARDAPPRRPVTRAGIRALLSPRSVAVVGASRDEGKQGGRLLRQLLEHGYDGDVLPINPSADALGGLPAFASVADLPVIPDLACIVVPAARVPAEVGACVARGIPAAIVYASGFDEAGAGGALLARELTDAVGDSALALCGPNTAGIVNFTGKVAATTSMSFAKTWPSAGSVALITQSGALGSSLLSRGWAQGVGFSHWICTGNEIGVTVGDYVAHLAGEPDVAAIVLFLEAVRDADAFRRGVRAARGAGKPVVVLKTGVSRVGRDAVRSHTAALAGDDRVYDAVFRELGVIRVDGLQTLLDVTITLSAAPPVGGPRLGVVSTSGGACSLIADEAERLGLLVPELPPTVQAAVAEVIPPFGATRNPVDLTMAVTERPEMVGQVTEILASCDDVDTVLVCLTTNADPPAALGARSLVDATRRIAKPVVVARVGAESLAPRALQIYAEARIPVFTMPERALRVAKALADHAALRAAGEEV
jgi:acetate---CoA ligase (ADP-forming)